MATEDDEEGGFVPGIDASRSRCVAEVVLELSQPKLLVLEVAERVAAAAMVRHTHGISKCYISDGKDGGPPSVQTDGLNFQVRRTMRGIRLPPIDRLDRPSHPRHPCCPQAAWSNARLVDVNHVETNDVGAMLDTYGVEAARATLVKEVRSVFGAYGIGVDPRHLGLIADFMTHQGGYRACNRIGIESSASPFLKMSFETATHFLTDATLKGGYDNLSTPASRIVMGRVVGLGSGCCEVLQKLDYTQSQ